MVFFIADDVDDSASRAMRELVTRLASSRRWTISPPEFVDEREEPENSQGEPLRTVGGVFRLYSAKGAWADKLPVEIDRAHLEEVRTVVDALRSFSAVTGHEIELELSSVHVGTIADGKADAMLEDGLLGAWAQTLRSRIG